MHTLGSLGLGSRCSQLLRRPHRACPVAHLHKALHATACSSCYSRAAVLETAEAHSIAQEAPPALQEQAAACAHPAALGSEHCTTSGLCTAKDEAYMRLALEQARLAYRSAEVPVGAVLVSNGSPWAVAHNCTHTRQDPLAHAEMLCIQEAARKAQAWRLLDATLYVTVEPCPMCAGAILQARLKRLVYGARQPRIGADGSWVSLFPVQQRTAQATDMRSRLRQYVLSTPSADGHSPSHQLHELQQRQLQRPWQLPLPEQEQAHKHGQHHQYHQPRKQEANGLDDKAEEELVAPLSAPFSAAAADDDHHAVPQQPRHPFHPDLLVTRGVLEEECAGLMKAFFRQRRAEDKQQRQAQIMRGHAGQSVAVQVHEGL